MNTHYVNVPTKLKEFLIKLRSIGVPDRTTHKWLTSLGYKSNNDRAMLKTLSFIGFTDNSGKPSDTWLAYRGINHKGVLAGAIMKGYADLYKIYPDAHSKDETSLAAFFSTQTTSGKQVIDRTVNTFMALCELADFNDLPVTNITSIPVTSGLGGGSPAQLNVPNSDPVSSLPAPNISTNSNEKPSLHIDIQIHISPESTADQIDQIFESMAKHLYTK